MTKNITEQLLEAAEAVIIRQGIGNLTIAAVATEAGMSKGGLLHHFPTKDKLIEALVARSAEQWRNSYRDAYERTSEGPGRMTRGVINYCITNDDCWTDELRSVSAVVFTALVQDPQLLQPMRDAYEELHERLAQDGLPPGVSEVVLSAIDGLWLNWVLGLSPFDQPRIYRVRQALKDIVAGALELSTSEEES
ncbi:MAG: TetR/AcrR family transcriptional regulator [Cyanobacteria bacterium P01_F01_bin.143]